jgi:hypothetical protein
MCHENLDPELIDLLKVQFKPERETGQCWLDMEEDDIDIPLETTTQSLFELSASIFVPNDPVLQIDW